MADIRCVDVCGILGMLSQCVKQYVCRVPLQTYDTAGVKSSCRYVTFDKSIKCDQQQP